jgi:hypothetical protein
MVVSICSGSWLFLNALSNGIKHVFVACHEVKDLMEELLKEWNGYATQAYKRYD